MGQQLQPGWQQWPDEQYHTAKLAPGLVSQSSFFSYATGFLIYTALRSNEAK